MALIDRERFRRQLGLPGFGEEGQLRLFRSRVLVVGAGGLGSPVIHALAAAGVGCLRIIDYDTVSLSNLNRQTLYRRSDIGRMKSEAASEWVRSFYPECTVEAFAEPLSENHLKGMDLAVDATDNYPARLLLDRLTETAGIPMVHSSVSGLAGQVATFLPGGRRYRELFPIGGQSESERSERSSDEKPRTIEDIEPPLVLGAAVQTIGSIEAAEVLKQLLGLPDNLSNRLLTADLSRYDFQIFDLM